MDSTGTDDTGSTDSSSDGRSGGRSDTGGTGWNDPDASDADGGPASSFPGAGERVGDDDRAAALAAQPDGNAGVGDMVDTDAVDSRAHDADD